MPLNHPLQCAVSPQTPTQGYAPTLPTAEGMETMALLVPRPLLTWLRVLEGVLERLPPISFPPLPPALPPQPWVQVSAPAPGPLLPFPQAPEDMQAHHPQTQAPRALPWAGEEPWPLKEGPSTSFLTAGFKPHPWRPWAMVLRLPPMAPPLPRSVGITGLPCLWETPVRQRCLPRR